jgi:hypothetical protein
MNLAIAAFQAELNTHFKIIFFQLNQLPPMFCFA